MRCRPSPLGLVPVVAILLAPPSSCRAEFSSKRAQVNVAPESRAASRADVGKVVRALEARYHNANSLKATFLERYSEGGREIRVEAGTVYFSRPGRMRWEYEAPETKLFLADGKTVWFYVPADRTVSRTPAKESSDWRTPLALLTGKARLSRLCSRIEEVEAPSGSSGLSRGHVLLRCWPRGETPRPHPSPQSSDLKAARVSVADAEGGFHEVLLEVETAGGELIRVVVRQAGGVEIEYRFANWQHNLPLSEALFHFQAPVGVAIVDDSSLGGEAH